jgi:hypothetical protein
VTALRSVDLPTFGKPTIPALSITLSLRALHLRCKGLAQPKEFEMAEETTAAMPTAKNAC